MHSSERRAVALTAREAERGLVEFRRLIGRLLDQLQLTLRRVETTADPGAEAWVASVRASLEDGSIWKRIKDQPEPKEIVERWRTSRSS